MDKWIKHLDQDYGGQSKHLLNFYLLEEKNKIFEVLYSIFQISILIFQKFCIKRKLEEKNEYKTIIFSDTGGVNGAKTLNYYLKNFNIKNCLVVFPQKLDEEFSEKQSDIKFLKLQGFEKNKLGNDVNLSKNFLVNKPWWFKFIWYREVLLREKWGSWAESLIQNCKPRRIILMNERMVASSTFLRKFKKEKIKIHILQHGNMVSNFFPTDADIYWVWGKNYSNLVSRETRKKVKTKIIGIPKEKIDFGIIPDKKNENKTILFFSQKSGSSLSSKILDSSFSILKKYATELDFNLLIKVHPNENLKKWKKIQNKNIQVVKTIPDKYLIFAACSIYSTALIDTARMKIPSFQIFDKKFKKDITRLLSNENIPKVVSLDEFKLFNKEISCPKNYEEFADSQSKSMKDYYEKTF